MEVSCVHCDGDGFYVAFHAFEVRCPHCKGTGKRLIAAPEALPNGDGTKLAMGDDAKPAPNPPRTPQQ